MTATHYSPSNIRKAIFHFVVGRGASAFAGVVAVILLARNMDTVEYAGYIAVTSMILLVAMFANFGLERAATRFVPEARIHRDPSELSSFIWKLVAGRFSIAVAVAIGLALLWPWVTRLFNQATALPSIPWAVPVFLVSTTTFSLFSSVLQALLEQRVLTRLMLIQSGGRLMLVALFLAFYGHITLMQSLWVMAAPELVVALGTALTTTVLLRKHYSANTSMQGEWPDWREVRHIAVHSYGFNILATLPQGYFMRTLIAATFPPHVTAAYGFFSTLMDRIRAYLPMQFMYSLIEPVMVASYLANPDSAALARRSNGIYKANLLLLLSGLILILVAGESFIDLLTHGKYGADYWMLALLLVQVIIGSHVLALQLFFNTLKATQLLSISGLGSLAFMGCGVWLSYLDPSKYWLLACPILYELAMNAIALHLARAKGIPYAVPVGNYVKLALMCAVLVSATKLPLPGMGEALQIDLAIGAVLVGAFLVLAFKMGAITQDEIAMVKRLAGRE